MVVIHRAYGFRFVIYTADHEPAHIHITGSGQAKSTCRDLMANLRPSILSVSSNLTSDD